jgi:hypothetical protein
MRFCSSCGGQLEGESHFCAKCGADQTAQPAAVQAPPPQAPPPPVAFPPPPVRPYAAVPPQYPPPPPVQPYAGMPPQYPPPVIMGVPPGAQPANNNNKILYIVLAAAAAYGIYYIHNQNPTPAPTPTPQTQPGQQPGPGPGGGGGGGGGGDNQAIVAAQKFTEGGYNGVNGQIQVTQGQWLNGSNVPLAAAELGCEQMDANGQNLTQDQVTLPGPAQPGQTVNLQTFSIGAEAQGAAKVNCKITAVETQN